MPGHPITMDKQVRRETRDAARAVAAWMDQARRAQAWQTATHEEVRRQLAALAAREVPVARAGAVAWRVMLLSRDDAESLLRALVARVNLPRPGPQEAAGLAQLTDRAPASVEAARVLSPVRWVFASRKRREQLTPHAAYLRELFAWGLQAELAGMLDRLARPTGEIDVAQLSVNDLLDPRLGLATSTGAVAQPGLLDGTRFGELPRAMADLRAATGAEAGSRNAVVTAVAAMRAPAVRSALEAMPLETLKEATTGTLRLAPLAAAGITTVQSVLDRRRELLQLPGIGSGFRDNLVAAAETLARVTAEEHPVRLEGEPTPASAAVVAALAAWDGVRRTHGAAGDLAIADELRPLAAVLDDRVDRLLVRPDPRGPGVGSRGRHRDRRPPRRPGRGDPRPRPGGRSVGGLHLPAGGLLRDARRARLPDRGRGGQPRRAPRGPGRSRCASRCCGPRR